MEFVDLRAQYQAYRTDIDAAMARVVEHARFIMGPEVAALESELANQVGVAHALTTGSGTVALEIALRALNIGPGDEVITTPFTWISTVEVIAAVGATPVLVDIDPVTFNLNPSLVAAAVTDRTQAIMPVSLFGQVADLEAINAIAAQHDLPVIEDAAQSFGATRAGRLSCAQTTIAATSFFPAKPLGCFGDGGALFTADAALAAKMRAIRTHGGERRHHHPYVGLNGRMDTLQCAIVSAKLPHYATELQARQRVAELYQAGLADCCVTPLVVGEATSVWAQYTIRVPRRDQVVASLKACGIPCAVYYPTCLHHQPAFVDRARYGALPEAERASQEVVSLPMHPFLSDSDVEQVVAAVRTAVDDAGGEP